jgi:hypothetical protein
VAHRHGDSTITAYFAPEDEEGCSGYMLTHLVSEESQQIREDQDEYSFLGYYGIRLTHPLVWSPSDWGDDQPCDIPSIRGWFPSYEGWGIS